MATDVQLAEHPLMSPKAELKPEKSGHKPRSYGGSGPQKKLVIPGVVDFERIRQALRTPKPQTPGTYRFGRLSHNFFFSRHHPHPQRVTHIQASNPLQISPGSLSVSSGTNSLQPSCLSPLSFPAVRWGCPPSLSPLETHRLTRTPGFLLLAGPCLLPEAWKRELKELASHVAFFTKEDELKKKEKEEPPREHGAKYSAETGRLIPASTRAVSRHSSHQSQGSQSSSRDEGVRAFLLQDQELLVLELLCQILETDSLSAIQFWLLYAPPKGEDTARQHCLSGGSQEKDLALGLLQTAVAQLLPQPLVSIPTEKLLNQLQEMQEPPQEKQELPCSQSPKKTKIPPFSKSEKPEYIGEAQVLRMHSSQNTEEKTSKPRAERRRPSRGQRAEEP
uniref:protein TBATA isoform X6 n=1 Tax=Callithrix jacchus TaxID=9483 RepID=UPI0023DD3BCC|nr:protein TBATA isoform X6 [Callithrix jacchus]